MKKGGFEAIVIWALLFIFFGPMAAAALTDSAGQVTTTLLPLAGTAGIVLVGVLAIRMFFRSY